MCAPRVNASRKKNNFRDHHSGLRHESIAQKRVLFYVTMLKAKVYFASIGAG